MIQAKSMLSIPSQFEIKHIRTVDFISDELKIQFDRSAYLAFEGDNLMIGGFGTYMTFNLANCHNMKLKFVGWANDLPILFETTDQTKVVAIIKQFVEIFHEFIYYYQRDEKTISV